MCFFVQIIILDISGFHLENIRLLAVEWYHTEVKCFVKGYILEKGRNRLFPVRNENGGVKKNSKSVGTFGIL